MVAIASGLWWDHSKTAILAATLTLPLNYSNLLLSGLTILVTIAGSSFWNIVAFFLHEWKAKSENPNALDLQQQVSLRNSAGATQTLWEAFKIHNATVVARVQPNNCGFWFFNTTGKDDLPALSAMGAKGQNDTRRARSHVANFYANTSSSAAPSIFVRPTLPYDISSSAPCPIPAHDRCILGPNKAFSIKSAFLDSHEMLGINAKFEDRVSIQLSLTCSPVHTDDLVQETRNEAGAFMEFFLGPIHDMTNYTYRYNKAIANKTGIGYLIQSYPGFAKSSSLSNPLLWKPIPDFSPIDADVTVHFLSQNNIGYLAPVYDPWFSANGTYNITSQGTTIFGSNRNVDTMVCADQYVLCNPSIASCTSPAGVLNLVNNLTSTTLNFSTTQLSTADRILYSLVQSNTYTTVANLGTAALWANNMVTGHVSYGLPDDQWKTEVIGWFQTNLAMLQAYVVDFASNTADLGSFGYVKPPRDRYQKEQCTSQLVQAVGEAQNFSVCGILIIVCISAALVLLDCSLERIVDFVDDFYGRDSMARSARQADNKLHLLRMALGGNEWVLGRWGIPVRDGAAKYNRPSGSKDLVSYRDSKTGEGTGCLQVCE
ncbi:hypothetical protein FOXG_18867 [Fusarium oxysporum f. sp. lycopersici 4287]|uniref:Uncharacterized protein n=1 Tax=Fusarium oxysporum f. sp. lycopersici (strain 4287 / CBS 123668 / FGSC 9935 / NRRL 34936) TaxID=426428 RepID=A0A0J9UQ27_FUSO4|nr:hypothetical protein FOXG_18867 [Fusarium oxysporum f. sp. lycopersici 4287]KAJ9427824.1 hypothetical protein QL093DRAFT_2631854 [Fusarium oxysporum]KNB01400.1 hypothetical protein FOXG_18867 [Fusarium oxysporum f. sp. lycopersici 4287]